MTPNKLTRRQALKYILAASGGLTAAAFLPAQWLKPIVQSGVLPVHARASVAGYYVTNDSMGTVGIRALVGSGVDNGSTRHLASPVKDESGLDLIQSLPNILLTVTHTAANVPWTKEPVNPAPRLTGGTPGEITDITTYGPPYGPYPIQYGAKFTWPVGGVDYTPANAVFQWIITAPNGSFVTLYIH